ncbi:hypothetical protein LPJ61_003708 [Coemansia biformis]|uniref:Fungal-type protein kinase domain-containing protein n=1 Tax=Coemansia biformis TaxID=1286918 RepID=A0A9W7Y642_9FUNG|nr:hypothetical protein LPJ61_003708 [Coemansia biformis]
MNPEHLPADELTMYPWIQAFIKFVADALPEAVINGRASIPGPNARGPRRIIAFQLTNVVAVDSDDMKRPDIVLTEDVGQTEGGVANNRPEYWGTVGVIELGYDPTIQWVEADGMWNIEIYDEASQETHTCHDAMMRHNTTSVFGRHTRCFRAKMTETVDGQARETDVIIKDSWAHASIANGIAPRNELAYLREISDKLCNHRELAGKYPHLNAGGIVRIRDSETPGVAIDDMTSTFISDLGVQMINAMHGCWD